MSTVTTKRLKKDLYLALKSVIAGKKLSKRQLQTILGASQPRISDLTTGKISKFSVEKLIEYLAILGAETNFKIRFGNACFKIKQKDS